MVIVSAGQLVVRRRLCTFLTDLCNASFLCFVEVVQFFVQFSSTLSML